MSLVEIALETGFKKTTIWEAIKLHKPVREVRPAVSYERWRKGHQRTGARPPYGFCFLLGEVVPEPKEYATLMAIYRLWNSDHSITSILARLEAQGSKSRTGKKWSYGVIRVIVERIEAEAIVLQGRKLVLSEQFLKGIVLPKKSLQKRKRSV